MREKNYGIRKSKVRRRKEGKERESSTRRKSKRAEQRQWVRDLKGNRKGVRNIKIRS